MQGVLIDDHRIHVDFSQSVSKLSDSWRTATNSKRRHGGGGFGGVDSLERKRQYRNEDYSSNRKDRYGMVYDEDELRRRHGNDSKRPEQVRRRSRSRSPRREVREYNSRDNRRAVGPSTNPFKEARNRDRDRYDDRDRDGRGRRNDYQPHR